MKRAPRRAVNVRLTLPQAWALAELCGFAGAGSPDMVGMDARRFDLVGRAHGALLDAIADAEIATARPRGGKEGD